MKRVSLISLSLLSTSVCFADYSSHGRPWDVPGYHTSPLTGIFMVIALIVLIGFAVLWIYDKVQENKETAGNIFGIVVFFGVLLGIAALGNKCEGERKTSSKGMSYPHYQQPSPNKNTLSPTIQVQQTQRAQPTLKYRDVEYQETCSTCNGTGHLVCPKCNGTGWITTTCTLCNGAGNHGRGKCIYCQGKGYTEDLVFGSGKHNCISCNSTGYVTNECHKCSGSGKISDICDITSVANHSTHYVSCSHCNGCGKVTRTKKEPYYE